MRKSLLIPGAENRFQKIKQIRLAREATGQSVINLGVGEPSGGANVHARMAAIVAMSSSSDKVHRYQDNDCHPVPDFAQRFVQANVKRSLKDLDLAFLPVPGLKPTLFVVTAAMGSWQKGTRECLVGTTTNPGYPTPDYAASIIRGVRPVSIHQREEMDFLFLPKDLDDAGLGEGDLISLNFPQNPTGTVGKRRWWELICAHCEERGIRIFNDAAYAFLSHIADARTLSDIAPDYPNLNWAEGFSASKGGDNVDGNLTGWRVGALVGSKEFMSDIANVNGNMNSGGSAFSMMGVLDFFENHQDELAKGRELYRFRLEVLINILEENGMKLAVEPEAGFFLLCQCPSRAFGQDVQSAEHFNQLMIENTGLVGVYFEPYIRYAVCAAPVEKLVKEIGDAFERAHVFY